jgi:hypothetical protein
MLESMMREADSWEGLEGFQGAYEESMHRVREPIIVVIGRDRRRLYGDKRINLKIQVATEQVGEVVIKLQQTRRNFQKLKDMLHIIASGTGAVTEADSAPEVQRQ